MSYERHITLHCDNFIGEEENQCGVILETPYSDVRSARIFAKSLGWKCEGEWDYCHKCYLEELENKNGH